VGVSKVGRIFVHKQADARLSEKSTSLVREATMRGPLPPDQEAQAQALAQALADAARDDFLEIARTLVAAEPAALFGDTEFEVREQVLALAAKAYQQRLAQKKTATRPPA
jgi:hypothetical protein